ncbi:MAG: 4-hydroxy-tetrahydrodipicolinate reductase [Rhizobiaceae bacterium]|nr:4-hydroxy-tetrahydrodipicolinate reductase [Rhizobiaceae bacterium]
MTQPQMNIVVTGAAGRMGRALIRALTETPGARLSAALERDGSPFIGQDAGTLAGLEPNGISVSTDAVAAIAAADGILDFTAPAATVSFAELAAQARAVHIVGTTGLATEHMAALKAAARHTVIMQSGNMSLGVNLLAALVEQAAKALDASGWDIEIAEMHHRHKVDAPSGTALLLGEAAARGRGIALEEHAVRVRDGHTGARPEGAIGFATLRGGSVVGEHSVLFAGEGETVELSHRAIDRAIFARGAVHAALWGKGCKPGFYTMRDVLGL